jgi:uncharacterized protein YkwD
MIKGLSRGIALVALVAALVGVSAAQASPAQPRKPAASLSSLEQGVLAAINVFRAQNHLAPLRLSTPLTTAAREHSQQMASQGYFAHESGDGSAFWKRIQRVYPAGSARYWSVGENLLWSAPSVDSPGAIRLWWNSPEHKKNMLDPHWREVGVAALHVPSAPGVFGGQEVTIVTTDFGVRR